jgi:1-aminocyclopropane-1-carboxylate deaminase/D-cysteine desulfhydrase-like pyridoxal-dependent ACC family enzyme
MLLPLSTGDLRAAADRLPRFPLGHFPTPLDFAERLSQTLGGPDIYLKRDDCTGLAFGGNKTRHNEFLIGDALDQQADVVVWGAGVQSNNCRQTAAACAKAGLDIHLLLSRAGLGDGPVPLQGNLLLDHLVGAHIDLVDERIGADLDARIEREAARYRERGRRVYSWQRPHVTPLAAVSYALCLAEIVEQCQDAGFAPDCVYVSSSGSTGAGLVLGKKLLDVAAEIINVAPIRWAWDMPREMAEMARTAAGWMGLEADVKPADVSLTFDHIGPGYGESTAGGLEAIALLARTEGVLLDPAYTAKAMAALIDDIRRGRRKAGEKVVFIHTGGTPALFAYSDELGQKIAPRRIQ